MISKSQSTAISLSKYTSKQRLINQKRKFAAKLQKIVSFAAWLNWCCQRLWCCQQLWCWWEACTLSSTHCQKRKCHHPRSTSRDEAQSLLCSVVFAVTHLPTFEIVIGLNLGGYWKATACGADFCSYKSC